MVQSASRMTLLPICTLYGVPCVCRLWKRVVLFEYRCFFSCCGGRSTFIKHALNSPKKAKTQKIVHANKYWTNIARITSFTLRCRNHRGKREKNAKCEKSPLQNSNQPAWKITKEAKWKYFVLEVDAIFTPFPLLCASGHIYLYYSRCVHAVWQHATLNFACAPAYYKSFD